MIKSSEQYENEIREATKMQNSLHQINNIVQEASQLGVKLDFNSINPENQKTLLQEIVKDDIPNHAYYNLAQKVIDGKHQIDWNQKVNSNNDTWPMVMQRNGSGNNVVPQIIKLKDQNGNPVYNINQKNKTVLHKVAGNNKYERLIDIVSSDHNESPMQQQEIKFLREHGSVEPAKPININKENNTFNYSNPHDQKNIDLIKPMMRNIHQKYQGDIDIDEEHKDLKKYLEDYSENKIDEFKLKTENKKPQDALNMIQSLIEKEDIYEDTINWNFKDEIAYLWKESKESGNQENFVQTLSVLPLGCMMGHLMPLYAVNKYENNEQVLYPHLSEIQADLSNQLQWQLVEDATKELKENNPANAKKVIDTWYNDQTSHPDDPENWRPETQLVEGLLNEQFAQHLQQQYGIDFPYSKLYKEYEQAKAVVVINIDLEDYPENNLFVKIYNSSEQEYQQMLQDEQRDKDMKQLFNVIDQNQGMFQNSLQEFVDKYGKIDLMAENEQGITLASKIMNNIPQPQQIEMVEKIIGDSDKYNIDWYAPVNQNNDPNNMAMNQNNETLLMKFARDSGPQVTDNITNIAIQNPQIMFDQRWNEVKQVIDQQQPESSQIIEMFVNDMHGIQPQQQIQEPQNNQQQVQNINLQGIQESINKFNAKVPQQNQENQQNNLESIQKVFRKNSEDLTQHHNPQDQTHQQHQVHKTGNIKTPKGFHDI